MPIARKRKYVRRGGIALCVGVIATIAVSWTAMVREYWYGLLPEEGVGYASSDSTGAIYRITSGANAWHQTYSYLVVSLTATMVEQVATLLQEGETKERQRDGSWLR